MEIRKLYINGEWVDSVHDEWIEIENPATHEMFAKVPRGNEKDVDLSLIHISIVSVFRSSKNIFIR